MEKLPRPRPVHVLAAVLALCTAACGWVGASPYLAASSLKRAAERGDVAEFERHVDLEAVRRSASAALATRAGDEARAAGGPVLGGVLAGVAGRLTKPAVDLLVTPESLMQAVRSEAAGSRDAGNLTTSSSYDDFDHFRLRFVDRTSERESLSIVLRRDGVATWRVCAVTLP